MDAVKAELGIWTTALMDQGAACLVSLPGEVCKDDFELKAGSKDRQSLLGTSRTSQLRLPYAAAAASFAPGTLPEICSRVLATDFNLVLAMNGAGLCFFHPRS